MRTSRFAFLAGLAALGLAPALPVKNLAKIPNFGEVEGAYVAAIKPFSAPYYIIDQFWVTETSPNGGPRRVLHFALYYPRLDVAVERV